MEFFINTFLKFRYSIVGLVAAYVAIFILIILPADSFLEKGIPYFWNRVIIYIFLYLIIFIIWLCFRQKLPRNLINKVGIFIAIDTENDKQKLRIKKDLINGMVDLLRQKGLDQIFHFIVLEGEKANRVIRIINDYSNKKRELTRSLSE